MTGRLLLELVVAAGLGGLAWTLIEYGIHGALSHRFRTFVSPLHWGHHANPHSVFTTPLAAAPVALLLYSIAQALVGSLHAGIFVAAVLTGFVHYEYSHWRIHFRIPRTPRERILRSHHLAHHFSNPRAYWGVTTRLWDHVFGSLPKSWQTETAKFDGAEPLTGESNLRAVWDPRLVVAEIRASRTRRF